MFGRTWRRKARPAAAWPWAPAPPWFPPAQVCEVDTPGLTSPVLERLDWQGLPRPVYPLGPEAEWSPPDWP